jgi:hypothetical protein
VRGMFCSNDWIYVVGPCGRAYHCGRGIRGIGTGAKASPWGGAPRPFSLGWCGRKCSQGHSRGVLKDRHAAYLIIARRTNSPQTGRIHHRRPSSTKNFSLAVADIHFSRFDLSRAPLAWQQIGNQSPSASDRPNHCQAPQNTYLPQNKLNRPKNR